MPHTSTDAKPAHPFWCDTCGGNAPFTIPGTPIQHANSCPDFKRGDLFNARRIRQAEARYARAVAWLKAHPGESIA